MARTTVVRALPDFVAANPEQELELSSTAAGSTWFRRGSSASCGSDQLPARHWLPADWDSMVNVDSPAYLARHGIPRSIDALANKGHRTIRYSQTLGSLNVDFLPRPPEVKQVR